MDEDIDEVVKAGIQAEEFAINLMGNPRQRVPVSRMKSREGPSDIRPSQSSFHERVFRNVIRVVVTDEWVAPRRQEYRQGDERKQQGNQAWARHVI